MEIRPFRVGDNFSYLIYCVQTGKTALLDPGMNASEAMRFIGNSGLELACVICTHHHLDHVAESHRVAELYKCDIIASKQDAGRIEGITSTVSDGETMVIGNVALTFLMTPGHTPGSMCVLADGKALFTGDTLFIGDCGRTDMPGGSNSQMFHSLQKLKELPDDTIIYPGHDYGNRPFDSLGNQKRTNKTLLAASLRTFSSIL